MGSFKAESSSIAQTPDGYLWLGTELGLRAIRPCAHCAWKPPPGQSLPADFIFSLLVARDGRLWIGTDKGLASWKDGKLATYAALAGACRPFHYLRIAKEPSGPARREIHSGRLCSIRNDSVQCHGQDGSFGKVVYFHL